MLNSSNTLASLDNEQKRKTEKNAKKKRKRNIRDGFLESIVSVTMLCRQRPAPRLVQVDCIAMRLLSDMLHDAVHLQSSAIFIRVCARACVRAWTHSLGLVEVVSALCDIFGRQILLGKINVALGLIDTKHLKNFLVSNTNVLLNRLHATTRKLGEQNDRLTSIFQHFSPVTANPRAILQPAYASYAYA
jgi:hypothetical protein